MPTRPQTRCPTCKLRHPGKGRCPACRADARAASDLDRGTTTERGYGHAHRETFRRLVLERDPVCVICGQAPATVADHWPASRTALLEAGLDPLDAQYGRGLCSPCDHTQTARRQPGGFADPSRPRG